MHRIIIMTLLVLTILVVVAVMIGERKTSSASSMFSAPSTTTISPWSEAQKNNVSDLLRKTKFFKCDKAYNENHVQCITSVFSQQYDYQTALDMLNGVKSMGPSDYNRFLVCLDRDCISEIFEKEEDTTHSQCEDCIVDKAIDESKGNKITLIKNLHDREKLIDYFDGCHDTCGFIYGGGVV